MIEEQQKRQWNKAMKVAALVAGDDPERCVALVSQMTIIADSITQLGNERKQNGFVGVGDSEVGHDGLLNGDIGGDAEGNPSEVA